MDGFTKRRKRNGFAPRAFVPQPAALRAPLVRLDGGASRARESAGQTHRRHGGRNLEHGRPRIAPVMSELKPCAPGPGVIGMKYRQRGLQKRKTREIIRYAMGARKLTPCHWLHSKRRLTKPSNDESRAQGSLKHETRRTFCLLAVRISWNTVRL